MTFTYCFDDNDFEYEVDWKDIREELVDILVSGLRHKEGSMFSYEGAYQMAVYIINDLDFEDSFAEYFEDDLKEAFEDKAYEAYKEACDEEKEQDDWYGTKANVLGVYR